MKKCPRCKIEKCESDFSFKKNSKDNLQSLCKRCNNTQAKQYYKDDIKDHKSKVRIREKLYQKKVLAKVQLIRHKLGCAKCSENDPRCLDFHHLVASEKVANISLLTQRKSMKKIMKEIEKCEVLCANCHRKEHIPLYIELEDSKQSN